MSQAEIKILPDRPALVEEAGRRVLAAAAEAIRGRGRFTIALSGGSTPRPLYARLAAPPWSELVDWSKMEIYWGDERCVPPDHPDSNFGMAREAMLSALPLPPENIHRMRGELPPQQAAQEYDQLLHRRFGSDGLDLALLGMGDNAHTASLFPDTAALAETQHLCVANFVPELGKWRLTLTAPFLNRSRLILFLVSGSDKAKPLHEVLTGPCQPLRFPVQLIDPPAGRLVWLLDAAAAEMIQPTDPPLGKIR